MLKSGTRLTVLTMGSRVLGLVREMTKAAFLGTSALSDAFSVAYIIPNLLRRLFAENSISVAFIPTFQQYLSRDKKDEVKEFLSATFTLLSFVTVVTVIIGMAITPFIIPFFGTGSDETVLLTRIMFPYLAVISIAAFFQGILNTVKVFSPSGFTPILLNLIIIGATYWLSPMMANPARAMSVGVLAGGIVQAGFQLPFVIAKGFKFGFVPLRRAFSNPGTKTVLRLIGPTILGMAAYQVNELASTMLAGNAGAGVVSSLNYSLRLQELVLGVFIASIGTVILPDLSAQAAKKEWSAFNSLLKQAVNSVALITIPVTFYSLVSGEGLITLLFKSRSFSDESVALTLAAFVWHIAGIYFIAMNRVIGPAFYAQSDTKSPSLAGIISVFINVAFAIALVGPMKGGGVALALSIASASNTVMLLWLLRKKTDVDLAGLLKSTGLYSLRMVAFSLLAAYPIWRFRAQIYSAFAGHNRLVSQGVPLLVSLCIFAAIGILCLLVTRDPIATKLVAKVREKAKK
jgi:putative peptidoglycan lipid II flippase